MVELSVFGRGERGLTEPVTVQNSGTRGQAGIAKLGIPCVLGYIPIPQVNKVNVSKGVDITSHAVQGGTRIYVANSTTRATVQLDGHLLGRNRFFYKTALEALRDSAKAVWFISRPFIVPNVIITSLNLTVTSEKYYTYAYNMSLTQIKMKSKFAMASTLGLAAFNILERDPATMTKIYKSATGFIGAATKTTGNLLGIDEKNDLIARINGTVSQVVEPVITSARTGFEIGRQFVAPDFYTR